MPANVYSDMNADSHLMEDQRALQLAFELSLLGLNEDDTVTGTNGNISPQSFAEEQAKRRSANMTECVPVPSSEHVAEIVGRQGKHTVFNVLTNSQGNGFIIERIIIKQLGSFVYSKTARGNWRVQIP